MIFDVSEVKLLNNQETELYELGFKEMWNSGMITFQVSFFFIIIYLQCLNANTNNSYGCKDYIRNLFEIFLKSQVYSN